MPIDINIAKHSNPLIEGAQALLRVACNARSGESVVLVYDEASDAYVLDAFVKALSLDAVATSTWDSSMYWCDPVKQRIPDRDVIIDIADRYLLHTSGLRHALQKDSRYGCFPELTPEFLAHHVIDAEHYRWLMSLSDWMARTLQHARTIRLWSETGTYLECDIGDAPIDDAGKPARQSGDITYITGQVSLYPPPDQLSGSIEVTGNVSPLGSLTSPLTVNLERGIVRSIHGESCAAALKNWLMSSESPHIRNMAHLSIGMIPGLKLTDRTVLSERVFGAVVLGFGAQPPGLGIFADLGKETSIHWDTITTGLSIVVDDRTLISKGRVVDEALASMIPHETSTAIE